MPSEEWHRFYQVTDHIPSNQRLFRSSAPNYFFNDRDQELTQTAVDFLLQHGITRIISANQHPYNAEELALLKSAGILYLHLPVRDFTPPTLEQFASAVDFFRAATDTGTLVHCGYGFGRTGTVITALQLSNTGGENPPESEWRPKNHVEKPEQMKALVQLRVFYREEPTQASAGTSADLEGVGDP